MRAYVGLGSNLGDRAALLHAATDALEMRGIRVLQRSPIYETDPVGGPRQPPYYNQVIEIETDSSPRELLALFHEVEAASGRDRANEERFGPRPIDLDILLIEDLRLDDEDLVVPHPRLHERAFVLVPLADIAPDAEVAGRGTVRELLAAFADRRGVRRTA
jgi:2-amino-4-hydroxy-6-hydroxymethyldihydropteridine diphosphokinase